MESYIDVLRENLESWDFTDRNTICLMFRGILDELEQVEDAMKSTALAVSDLQGNYDSLRATNPQAPPETLSLISNSELTASITVMLESDPQEYDLDTNRQQLDMEAFLSHPMSIDRAKRITYRGFMSDDRFPFWTKVPTVVVDYVRAFDSFPYKSEVLKSVTQSSDGYSWRPTKSNGRQNLAVAILVHMTRDAYFSVAYQYQFAVEFFMDSVLPVENMTVEGFTIQGASVWEWYASNIANDEDKPLDADPFTLTG